MPFAREFALELTLTQLKAENSAYMAVQQHLSSCFFASLQNSFPFFCCSQQHVFTSLPVSVHVIFCEAADAIVPMANAASSGNHFVISFINSPPSMVQLHLFTRWSHAQGRMF